MKEVRSTKLSNYHRAKILSLLKEFGDLTISQLAEKIEVTRPTIYLHLETLKDRGLITSSKDPKKKGAPVTISLTNKAQPVSLKLLEETYGRMREWGFAKD